jgi:hypothetical protein
MTFEPRSFYSTVVGAGAILMGFCGTFLAFRIQREAGYHRSPATDRGKDTYFGLTQFTSSLLLLLVATAGSMTFGFVLPLFELSGIFPTDLNPKLVVGGLTATCMLIAGYFVDELVHYYVFKFIKSDRKEWKREGPVVVATLLLAVGLLVLFMG